MNGNWKDRRERLPFDIFETFKEIEKVMNELEHQPYDKNKQIRPRVYVFLIRTDSSLKAKTMRRANMVRRRYGSRDKEQREALVDVFDGKDEVVVVAELPHVKKEDIELHIAGNFLTVSVNKPRRRILKTIELPVEVNVEKAKMNYKNGVLEVVLPKKQEL